MRDSICKTAVAAGVVAKRTTKIEVAGMRYKADMTAGALKAAESRIIADLLLRNVDHEGWKDAS